mmetsp:Transcript_17299/g.22461  ORF Transcript_17299/g.22461 Transcript_17299/m.22461 type:complete len:752 (+) Transcript_17299:74-2329(+)
MAPPAQLRTSVSFAFDEIVDSGNPQYDADQRYLRASKDEAAFNFFAQNPLKVPTSRSPYQSGVLMCRGAAYFPMFKDYIEQGGIARFKNSVVASIRINSLHSFDEMNGTFAVSYYMDTAFWVPEYNAEFYDDIKTVGEHTRYEPHIHFPDTVSARITKRTVEFSKDAASRRHEVQIGQNLETITKIHDPTWLELNNKFKPGSKVVHRNNDSKGHWPRMWRILCSDDEMDMVQQQHGGAKRKYKTKGLVYTKQIRDKLESMDLHRAKLLSHPKEGIVFLTHEVEAVCLEHFDLLEFPYDTQAMSIKVRVEKASGDPLNRFLVPLCTDKGFFCTSRVAPLVEWKIAKNLHWEVTAGAGGDPSRDGGKQRLIARVVVCRKSYYYTAHYIIMAFSISTISFTAFSIEPVNVTARVNVVLTILLTVVAFNYVCQDKIPKVPYSTILDKFLICNHIAILIVGLLVMLVCYMESHEVSEHYLFGMKPNHEPVVGTVLFFIWILGNAYFGGNTYIDVQTVRHNIDISQQLEFLDFSRTQETNRDFIDQLYSDSPFTLEPIRKYVNNFINFILKITNIGEYYKLKKKKRNQNRNKVGRRLNHRGFEVCGSHGEKQSFYFNLDILNDNNDDDDEDDKDDDGNNNDNMSMVKKSPSSNINTQSGMEMSNLSNLTMITEDGGERIDPNASLDISVPDDIKNMNQDTNESLASDKNSEKISDKNSDTIALITPSSPTTATTSSASSSLSSAAIQKAAKQQGSKF